jgi:hypothetical protein
MGIDLGMEHSGNLAAGNACAVQHARNALPAAPQRHPDAPSELVSVERMLEHYAVAYL